MENTATDIMPLVKLQLIGAVTGQNGLMSVKSIYNNICKNSDVDISYSDFIAFLEENRDEFKVRDGKIGAEVSYITLKK